MSGTFAANLIYSCLSKHSNSPAVTWAESAGLWKLILKCLPDMQLSLDTSQPNNWRIWCYLFCQIDAKLSTKVLIDTSWVCRAWGLISVIWVFFLYFSSGSLMYIIWTLTLMLYIIWQI